MNTQYTYEIEFDVVGVCRERYEQWLSDESVEWVSHPAIAAFEVQYNTNGLSPEIKFVFGFSSIDNWTEFVTSETHENAKETLRGVTTELDGTLWQRGGIKLDSANVPECDTPLSPDVPVGEELP